MLKFLTVALIAVFLNGCATVPKYEDPKLSISPLQKKFKEIKPLDGPQITIAVYSFSDKTGQRKPSQKFSQLSSAVTQGAEVWVIRSTREQYEEEKNKRLKPLLFAGLIVEGAVVGYDSNIMTGGAGARYLGIGLQTQYRVDNVTVSMRVVSVSTGEVLLSVAVEKQILSVSQGGDVFKFLDMGTRAVEIESGTTVNEPVNYAVRAAIEQAVVEMILKGEKKNLWKFKQGEKINVK
jgi:curli production assembly/transport component CsgG